MESSLASLIRAAEKRDGSGTEALFSTLYSELHRLGGLGQATQLYEQLLGRIMAAKPLTFADLRDAPKLSSPVRGVCPALSPHRQRGQSRRNSIPPPGTLSTLGSQASQRLYPSPTERRYIFRPRINIG
jgi:hypothetical protein